MARDWLTVRVVGPIAERGKDVGEPKRGGGQAAAPGRRDQLVPVAAAAGVHQHVPRLRCLHT